MSVSVFGIRHHGPGSARSLLAALRELAPDIVLVEGPPDADEALEWIGHEDLEPPVALLVHAVDEPRRAAFFPFAEFSPEWQALRFARETGVVARCIDLPLRHRLALERAEETRSEDEAKGPRDSGRERPRPDPLTALAAAAGYDDGERWWEHLVEERRHALEIFAAVSEAMAALREGLDTEARTESAEADAMDDRNALREAWMRREIRRAAKEGHERIAVVCGAWHAPALEAMPPEARDREILRGLPKLAVAATWVPWTYGRLARGSGYGAGVDSPGYYHHLWEGDVGLVPRWLTRVARLLRERGVLASSAQVIDAVRLADALAAMRGRSRAGLAELEEATQAALLHGEALPLRLVREQLIVGERMGRIPASVPAPPLVADLARRRRRVRLELRPEAKEIVLDLRQPNDRERSELLRGLRIIGVDWGEGGERARGKGTFKERWVLAWKPELELRLIEAGTWGNTVPGAASRRALELARGASELPRLAELAQEALFAGLGDAVPTLLERLCDVAAVASDVGALLAACPRLAALVRYGDVRDVDRGAVREILEGLFTRAILGLPRACRGLGDDEALELVGVVEAAHRALDLVELPELAAEWSAVLRRILDDAAAASLLRGRACRLLHASATLDENEVATLVSRALSPGAPPDEAAAWVEGFLRGSGQVLVHDPGLLRIFDEWVVSLPTDVFSRLLPIVRRTFATFADAERRQIGLALAAGSRAPAASEQMDGLDESRAARALPSVMRFLGLEGPP